MSDQNNSTQTSSKGETNIRPTPIGGDFATFEEKEPELGAVIERSSSAFSAIGNLDFQLPTKVASTLFETGKWTVLGAADAIGGILKEVAGSEKPKPQPKPEERKKMEDGLALRQALEVIENARISNAQQEMHKSDSEAERIVGRRVSTEEANKKLNRNASFVGKLSYSDLVNIRNQDIEDTEQVKDAQYEMQSKEVSQANGTRILSDGEDRNMSGRVG